MEKKLHWKTAEKLAKESPESVAPESVADIVAPKGKQYRVFDSRMNIAAQVYSLEEAEEELTRFVGGKIVQL